MLELRNKYFL